MQAVSTFIANPPLTAAEQEIGFFAAMANRVLDGKAKIADMQYPAAADSVMASMMVINRQEAERHLSELDEFHKQFDEQQYFGV